MKTKIEFDKIDWVAWRFKSHHAGTRTMHPTALGIYTAALLQYYCESCKGLPPDDSQLRAICNGFMLCDEDWNVHKLQTFGGKFTLGEDGLWHHERAQLEFMESVEKMSGQQRCSEGGKASYIARKKKGIKMPNRWKKESEQVHSPVHKPFTGPPPRIL